MIVAVWMAELSERSGLPVPTIKFYLREGLLPPGESLGATRARYDETHLQRLRLIRALVEVAQLRLDVVRSVLDGVDRARSRHEAIGIAHARLSSAPETVASEQSLRAVDGLLERMGWQLMAQSPHRQSLARALDAIASLGYPVGDDLLDAYGHAMGEAAEVELDQLEAGDRESAVEHAVIGTLLLEPVLLTIRRIAQVNASHARLWAT
jgi:DNA-binding transcriptional MerR regulator